MFIFLPISDELFNFTPSISRKGENFLDGIRIETYGNCLFKRIAELLQMIIRERLLTFQDLFVWPIAVMVGQYSLSVSFRLPENFPRVFSLKEGLIDAMILNQIC
jgi:hypothetical protein